MNNVITTDTNNLITTQIVQDDIEIQEYILNPILPNANQVYPEETWTLGDVPIYINNSTLVQLTEADTQNNIQNIQLQAVIRAEDVNKEQDVPVQLIEENYFSNEDHRLVVTSDVTDQIEMISAHKCKLCGLLFERYDAIIAHVQSVHSVQTTVLSSVKSKGDSKDMYLCGKCDKKFVAYESIDQLKLHMIVTHNLVSTDIEKQESSENNEINEELLKKMVHNHEIANKKVKCMIKGCDNSFARNEIMLKHMEYHTEGMKKKFKCNVCDKLFFIWRTCRAHIWKAHKIDVGLYECAMCKSFKCLAPYDLLAHMKCHSNPKNFKPFLCSTCGVQFNRLAELRNHSNSHTVAKPWSVNCPKCDKSFANNKYLKRHIQSVHDQYKPFVCNICGHKCARKSMLDLHLRQHTGEKPYKCELCDFKTGDHNSFRRHALRHSGLTNYSCQYCKYATIQSNAFKLHMKKKHPGKGGFFSCTICPFNSVNEKLYQQHLEKHKRAKPLSSSTEDTTPTDKSKDSTVPNIEDEETQIGLFPDHLEDTVDTGGITIPAGIEQI